MTLLEIILLAIGLSFDTFAVSVSTGLTINSLKFRQGVRIAFVLAFFQSLMAFIGWLGGIQIEKYISNYDHWIAFGLLSILGIKMITEAFKEDEEKTFNPMLLSVLIGMALATSIDALVAGVSMALINTSIYLALIIIGVITFLVSMTGILLGKNVTGKFGKRSEIIGGLILAGIGLKILISHLA
jgi:putative Mn2+ efflux pump MntP